MSEWKSTEESKFTDPSKVSHTGKTVIKGNSSFKLNGVTMKEGVDYELKAGDSIAGKGRGAYLMSDREMFSGDKQGE